MEKFRQNNPGQAGWQEQGNGQKNWNLNWKEQEQRNGKEREQRNGKELENWNLNLNGQEQGAGLGQAGRKEVLEDNCQAGEQDTSHSKIQYRNVDIGLEIERKLKFETENIFRNNFSQK